MRYTLDLFALGAVLAAVGWFSRAPAQADARASYLCAPVAAAQRTLVHLQAALSDVDQVIPPEDPRLTDLPWDCERMVLRLTATHASDAAAGP